MHQTKRIRTATLLLTLMFSLLGSCDDDGEELTSAQREKLYQIEDTYVLMNQMLNEQGDDMSPEEYKREVQNCVQWGFRYQTVVSQYGEEQVEASDLLTSLALPHIDYDCM